MPLIPVEDASTAEIPLKGGTLVPRGPGGRRMVQTPRGRRLAPSKGLPDIPFLDRSVLAAMDNPDEQHAFLSKKYGEANVSKDKKGFIVTVNGRKMRAETGFASQLVADAPELTLGLAGAAAGAPEGPLGVITGAGIGGATGKSVKEAIKSATGVQRKSPQEIVSSVGKAGVATAAGQAAAGTLGLARKLPLRSMVFDTTSETKAMTERVLKGGARPPAQSTMPSARKFQRIAILAEKLSGPNKSIDRANLGYLQDRASALLDKAGIKTPAKDETMSRLVQSESSMSFQDTGRVIQQNAKWMLDQVKGKDAAYLKQLSAAGKTPEDAYHWVVNPGQTDRLERFVKVMGENSQVVEAVRKRALRELLSGSLVRNEQGEAVGALEKELSQFTTKQQNILFPGGLKDDLKLLSKEIGFLYPKIHDPSMAGFTGGTIMQHIWYQRWYAQMAYSFGRAMLQKPAIIRRLAVGLRGDSKTRIATRAAIKEMLYFGALEMNNPGKNPDEIAPAGQ